MHSILKSTFWRTTNYYPDMNWLKSIYIRVVHDWGGSVINTTPIQRGNNVLGGEEEEYAAYNFMEEPLNRQHVHTAIGNSTQTEVCTYK